jgi:hypothetical protein
MYPDAGRNPVPTTTSSDVCVGRNKKVCNQRFSEVCEWNKKHSFCHALADAAPATLTPIEFTATVMQLGCGSFEERSRCIAVEDCRWNGKLDVCIKEASFEVTLISPAGDEGQVTLLSPAGDDGQHQETVFKIGYPEAAELLCSSFEWRKSCIANEVCRWNGELDTCITSIPPIPPVLPILHQTIDEHAINGQLKAEGATDDVLGAGSNTVMQGALYGLGGLIVAVGLIAVVLNRPGRRRFDGKVEMDWDDQTHQSWEPAASNCNEDITVEGSGWNQSQSTLTRLNTSPTSQLAAFERQSSFKFASSSPSASNLNEELHVRDSDLEVHDNMAIARGENLDIWDDAIDMAWTASQGTNNLQHSTKHKGETTNNRFHRTTGADYEFATKEKPETDLISSIVYDNVVSNGNTDLNIWDDARDMGWTESHHNRSLQHSVKQVKQKGSAC